MVTDLWCRSAKIDAPTVFVLCVGVPQLMKESQSGILLYHLVNNPSSSGKNYVNFVKAGHGQLVTNVTCTHD